MFGPDTVGAFSLLFLSIGLTVLFIYSPLSFFSIPTILGTGVGLSYCVLSGFMTFPVALFILLITLIYLKVITLPSSS